MKCCYCKKEVNETVLDLGPQPPANSLLESEYDSEKIYPLMFVYCANCNLYQRGVTENILLFNGSYPYRTSVSKAYVEQCRQFIDKDIRAFGLDTRKHTILEVGANDGSLVNIWRQKGFEAYGIDPCFEGDHITKNFFTCESAKNLTKFDYVYAFNVAAHVPDLEDFIEALSLVLNPKGLLVIEIADVKKLFEQYAWDTIYHEHFAYFSFNSIVYLFAKHGMELDGYAKLKSHGGSLRLYFRKRKTDVSRESSKFDHRDFKRYFLSEKERWLGFFHYHAVKKNQSLPVFGAAAKGITFINSIGLKSDLIPYCVDETTSKIGKYMPMSRIPIVGPNYMQEAHDMVNLAWNHKKEIAAKYPKTNFYTVR